MSRGLEPKLGYAPVIDLMLGEILNLGGTGYET